MSSIPKRIRSERGYSLIEAVVVLAVLAVAGAATQTLLAAASRGSAAGDFKQSVSALSSTLRERVSCEKTFETVNLQQDCFPSIHAKPLVLKDGDGDPVTEPLIAANGPYNPLDNTLLGSSKLGSFQLRAYCDRNAKSLVIRYAKPLGQSFQLHPTTRLPLDWQKSSTNPLFGIPERTLCSSYFGASGKPAGLIATKAVFRRVMTAAGPIIGIPVVGPTNSRLVKITSKGQNLAQNDVQSEDTADLYVLVDLNAQTSTGYYAVTGGAGEENTVMFSWNDRPFNAIGGIDGDRVATSDYGMILTATFQPRFSFDKSTGQFRIEGLPIYYPAQYVFLFEFYGD